MELLVHDEALNSAGLRACKDASSALVFGAVGASEGLKPGLALFDTAEEVINAAQGNVHRSAVVRRPTSSHRQLLFR